MLKNKSIELIQNLKPLIRKYSKNDKVRNIIVKEFVNRNMRGSNAIYILNENLKLNTLNIDIDKELILLFVFTIGLYKALSFKNNPEESPIGGLNEILSITPEDYFTELEIQELTDFKLEKINKKDDSVVFPNMCQTATGFWVGNISSKYLAELDAGNEFVYNFKTQRDPVIDIYGIKRIHLNKKTVAEIQERLLAGKQFPTTIVVNVLHDGQDKVNYNEKTGDLTILSGVKNMVDGQHRKVANSLAIEKNPDLDFNWILVITNYSEIKAQEYMVEINKQQKMKPEHIKSLDISSYGNLVVDTIKDIPTCEFATTIRDSDAELKFGGLTKKSILATAIEDNYKITNRLQVKPIAEHIAKIMDYILGLYIKEFIINPEETKELSYINNKNMFYGYVALSKVVYEDKDWENSIEEIMNLINFNKNNQIWDNIKIEVDNKTLRKNLYSYFQYLYIEKNKLIKK